jgi:transcriptional regulator with XRE-family HTH domain
VQLTTHQVRKLRSASLAGRPNKIKLAMTLARVTQMQVAAALGLPQSQISKDVRVRRVSLDKARAYARLFGCSVDDLYPESALEAEAVAS